MRHPIFARFYEKLSVRMDRAGAAEHRHALVAGLYGRVIEIGAGNGLMFAHYPATVTEVLAVEPEPRLRATAQAAAWSAPVPVRGVDGLAGALPAGDGEFDAAVTALVLCSVPDQQAALAEIRRVLRSGRKAVGYWFVSISGHELFPHGSPRQVLPVRGLFVVLGFR